MFRSLNSEFLEKTSKIEIFAKKFHNAIMGILNAK